MYVFYLSFSLLPLLSLSLCSSFSNDITPSVEMNRLIQKQSSSSTNSQQKLHQMLNASSIQAQEQQVTSLRELLRQEESRLELLKKMRQPNESPSIISKDLSSHERGGVVSTGVIRSGDALITHNGKWLEVVFDSFIVSLC